MKVLVVDDDDDVLSLIGRTLGADGHVIVTADRLAVARRFVREVDLIVLDIGLPDGSGLELCREERSRGSSIPILVLTARSRIAAKVEGLDAGADDYLAKPFAVAELRARVRALGRRAGSSLTTPVRRVELCGGTVVLDFSTRIALVHGSAVPITARQWAILDVLAARPGQLVTRAGILELVWGRVSEANASSLEVLIARLRKKLGTQVLRTIRGEGYALDVDA